jgi:hypothetical protein
MTEELSSIKKNCHYGKGSKGIAIDKALVAEIKKKKKKKDKESRTWQ